MAPLSIGLILASYQKWSWGLSVLTISFVLVWLLAIVDSRKGPYYFKPPCQEACPGGIPCSHYVHLAAAGKDLESLELVELFCVSRSATAAKTVNRWLYAPLNDSWTTIRTGPITFIAGSSTRESNPWERESLL
jgi:hypothetical protein